MRLRLIALLALSPLAACSTVSEAVRGPELAPVGYPAALVGREQSVLPLASAREVMPQPASANSLWRTGARAFFNDQRASRVGDILTVQIDIDDSAKTTNATSSSRTSGTKAGVPHLLGLESTLGKILPGGFDPANAIETNSTSNNAGAGQVNRSEKISLTIAAVVTGVLPNGNMMIQGTQEVRTNTDLRSLTVAGIVRPEDISSANTVRHTQIAEARISYGGRGDISRVQKTPAGQSLVERFSPF
ncbi:MAG: flagellar basal body L-ring protein FlgH [Alphaproteobacteria bacterium]|nr:flagellar basal body L-ring protein FlgH [Alphaproteobacteria bacterium]MBU1515575.1 flagellar basal body L-ring protein FlgH [Alphaproteobacteria bacterium]MBU2095573.1 flagellar basal body L-ring protein FlgH [Alphaproteobacteria bacterium]MBU2150814.1 flagellar basal body L-ring protein FlgH [Alphaproteobacteria bacterium]MBU2307079.1 flagellar basal body L-ring protein FlgH [Alphaproteobacteria bacterium]